MKGIITTAAVALLVSLVCTIGLHYAQKVRTPQSYAATAEELAATRARIESITALHSEVLQIRNQFAERDYHAYNETPSIVSLESKKLSERLQVVEDAIEELLVASENNDNAQSIIIEKRLSEDLLRSSSIPASPESDLLERALQNDSGVPLGDFSDSIDEALGNLESIDVRGLECGDTACKVSYSRAESWSPHSEVDGRSELMDKLVQETGGREVDISYATDSSGNDVMYIQLR